MVVATGLKGEIGLNNKLLWHIPEDLKNFKKITTGKMVVMGRNTFESIGRPLPNRTNVVISRDLNFKAEGVIVIDDPLSAFDVALEAEADELMVIGGGEIYKSFMPYAQKIYLSEMNYQGLADTFFPAINPATWREINSITYQADEKNNVAYTFSSLERI